MCIAMAVHALGHLGLVLADFAALADTIAPKVCNQSMTKSPVVPTHDQHCPVLFNLLLTFL